MEEMLLCQTCLVTGVHIHPMSAEDMETYRLFVTKLEDPLDVMYVCGQCKGIMKKINKFIKQCRLAEQVLQDYNSNSKRLHFSDTCRLSTSETVCHYIGPEADKKSKSDDKISQGDGKLFQGNDKMSQGDDKMSQSDDKVSQGDDKMSQGDDKIFEGDDKISEGDDDTPLVMLILNNDDYDLNNYDNHAELDNLDTSIDNIKQETNTQTDTIKRRQKKFRRKKKEAGKGFSSRMVMETAEYKVIKLTKEEIREEMRLHSESDKYKLLPYKCEQCVRGFNFDDVLQSHMQKHSPKNGYFQCEICAQYCASRVSLRGHMKSHSTRYKCKLCGLVRLSRQHILEHHSLQHTGSPALYSCPQCDHTTHKRTAMQRHVRLHSASEPLKCHYCGKYYKTKESLRIHIMRHDDKKLHQCEICTSSFVYAAQLTKHMRSVHVLKDYYCVECDIMFKSMDNLKQHLQRAKRHRDDSSYKFQCGQCSERFVSASTLATHRTNAHGAARSEACALCPRAYSSPEALRWHTRRAHTARDNCKLPCPLCEREFSRKYVLRVHMRTHTGERPHACECGAGFAQPAALRAHRAAHHKKPAVTSEIET